jgi:hypothetical protein
MVELWTAHAEKQFKELTEQTKELSALGQKMGAKAAQPLRSIFLVHREIHSPLYSRPRPAGA